MKIKIADILNKEKSLAEVLTKEVPVKAGYRLGRNLNKINSELRDYNNKRNELIKKYGEKNKKGDIEVKQGGEQWDNFSKDLGQLLDEEIEVDLMKVNLEMLGDIKIKSTDMAHLVDFIIEE